MKFQQLVNTMGNCFGKRKDYKHVKTDDNEVIDIQNVQPSPNASSPPRLEFIIPEENTEAIQAEPPALLKTEHVPNPDDATDFPFLRDQKTINHIQRSQTLFILRGPPGSGKSTLVNRIQNLYKSTVICSADHYFIREDGQYRFDAAHLPYAHKNCQENAKMACSHSTPVVVIDNTNTKRWEMKPYIDMAKANQYVVIIFEPKTKWRYDVEELVKRNSHGVNADDIRKKLKAFEEHIPFYYGWFLSISDSQHLKQLAKDCLLESVKTYPEIREKMFPSITSLSDLTEEMVLQYFDVDGTDSPCLFHCTAKFLGSPRNPAPRRTEYLQREDVKAACGKAFELTITSITISPRTLGARVVLTTAQCKLFDKPEEEERDEITKTPLSRKSVNSFEQEVSSSILERGRSAHVTISTADGIKNVQTTFDLLDICDLEWKNLMEGKNVESIQIEGGHMRYVGGDYCEVELNNPIRICTLFTGFY